MPTADEAPFKCVFCLRSDGAFSSVEHVIPESLGNDEAILPRGWVCDACNQYFGSKIESRVSHSWEFGRWRCDLALATKKGKLPIVRLPGGIGLAADGSGETCLLFDAPNEYVERKRALLARLSPGQTGVFRVPALSRRLVSRFLGKIGLGLVAAELGRGVFDSRYDQIRGYVRVGNKPGSWDVACGVLPERHVINPGARSDEEEVTVYAYGMAVHGNDSDIVFAFQYGFDVYAMYLTRPDADEDLLRCLEDTKLCPF